MSWRKNEVLIEWMDRSFKGEQNRVNVKHKLADAEDITVGAVVTARINSRKYTGTVLDLLEWSAPQKAKRKRKPAAMSPSYGSAMSNPFGFYVPGASPHIPYHS